MRSIFLLALLCPLLSHSQLSIGSKLPPLQLTPMVNCSSDTISTASLKGKYILLEFFATWCTACMKKMPMLDSLQRAHEKDLLVMLVGRRSTIDKKDRVLAFFEKRKNDGYPCSLPALVGDTVLNKLFHHNAIPYAVLLDKAQKVLAFFNYDELTPQNLEAIIHKKTVAIHQTNPQSTFFLLLQEKVPEGRMRYNKL